MQLLLKRGQSEGAFGRIKFDLWAKFEVTAEENELLAKYRAHTAVLSEGDTRRDLIRAAKYAAGVGLLVALWWGLPLGIIAFAGLTYLIYHQIREQIRVSDILAGRDFACRSVITLMEKEATVTEMAVVFRRFLDAMKTWGGAEVIDIEPEREPTVRVLEESRRAAA